MADQLETILSEGLDALSLPYTDDTLHRFRLFYTLLSERSQQMNLTAISGEADVARLHMLDCAAILPLVSFTGKRVLDVGSGAGFPGLVLKLLCPDLSLTLLDSTQKRVQSLGKDRFELFGHGDLRNVDFGCGYHSTFSAFCEVKLDVFQKL